jgi:hypothetical protein
MERRYGLLFFPFPTCSKAAFLILIFLEPPDAFRIRARRHGTAEIFPFESLVVDSGHQKGPRSRDSLASIPQVVHIRLSLPVIVIFQNQKRALVLKGKQRHTQARTLIRLAKNVSKA